MTKLHPSNKTSSEAVSTSPFPGTRWYRDKAVLTGSLGILCFSLTLPATHLAVATFGGIVVGLGRDLIAATLAGLLLLIKKEDGWRVKSVAGA